MRKSPAYVIVVALMVAIASTIAYAQLSYTPPSFAPKQVVPSATFNSLFSTIDSEALNRTAGVMAGWLRFSPDNSHDIGQDASSNRPRDLFLGRNAAIGGALTVTGASTFAAIGATNGTFSGTLGVTGASTLAALSATTGSFSSTLAVTGATTLSSTLGVSGSSTLAALSATTGSFSSTLAVTGAATLSSTLSVSGASTLAALSATTGTFSSTLGVTGATTLSSTLSVAGASTLAGLSATDLRVSGNVPSIRITENDQATDNKQWQMAVSGSVFGLYVINDAESAGAEAVTFTRSTTTPVLMTIKTALMLTKSRNITTANGEQTIALNADDYLLRVSTGGTGTADTIIGFSGGVAGREIKVCMVSSTTNGDLQIGLNDASASASDRILRYDGSTGESTMNGLGACYQFIYDGTSSAWRSVT